MIKRLVVLLLLSALLQTPEKPAQPHLVWTRALADSETVVVTAWSPTASCVAAATDKSVHVIDVSGEHLWQWNFHETNRLIQVGRFSSIALSPTCDAVLVAGGVEYKYVWAGDRRGRRTFFKTAGTPPAVKFDLHGKNVAVVTGAAVGYLLSRRLSDRWSGKLAELPVRWPSQLLDSRLRRIVGSRSRWVSWSSRAVRRPRPTALDQSDGLFVRRTHSRRQVRRCDR